MAEKRRVELTDDQYEQLWQEHRTRSLAGKLLSDMAAELLSEMAKSERMQWECLARTVGADRRYKRLTIDWINRCVLVEDREPQEFWSGLKSAEEADEAIKPDETGTSRR